MARLPYWYMWWHRDGDILGLSAVAPGDAGSVSELSQTLRSPVDSRSG